MVERTRRFAVLAGLVAAAFLGFLGLGSPALAVQPLVEKLVLSDTIQPVTAGQLDRAIARANADGCLLYTSRCV